MRVRIENIEVRGHEVKESKKDGRKYVIVRFEDETGKSYEIIDRDMENEGYYKRGTLGDFLAELTMGKTRDGQSYARLEVASFQIAGAGKETA